MTSETYINWLASGGQLLENLETSEQNVLKVVFSLHDFVLQEQVSAR